MEIFRYLKSILFGEAGPSGRAKRRATVSNVRDHLVPEADSALEPVASFELHPVTERLRGLLDEASKFYPHGDTERALDLGREAIDLLPEDSACVKDPPFRQQVQYAFWMVWVCLDLLERPEHEVHALIDRARVYSPETAAEIEQRIADHELARRGSRDREDALDLLLCWDGSELSPVQRRALDLLLEQAPWWEQRDAGVAIGKGPSREVGLRLLEASCRRAEQDGGNIPSIWVAIGDLHKRGDNHLDAARAYLESCIAAAGPPLVRAKDQVRISLKKAGVRGDPAAHRDQLLDLVKAGREQRARALLEIFLNG